MFPFIPSLLLILLLAAPALLTTSTSHELQVRGQRTPRDAKQDSIKVVISEGCANQGDSSDVSQGGKEIDLTPGSPLVLTHKIKLVPSDSGLGAGSCGCEADFAALRERLERLEREVSSLREKCGGAEGGCCTSKESKGAGCSIKPGLDGCPNECSDQGRCVDGKCVCFTGFSGPDCSMSNCPGNCNDNGRCVNGQCVCDPGFTGPDCSQRGCPDNCNNHGRCVNGRCACDTGFAGPSCSDQSCPGNCNNRGRCVNGQCVCNPGFTSPDCSKKACPNNCSDRGRCMNGKCVCDSGFTGADCSADSCPGNCNKRGRCINGQCVCNPGFTGPDCSKRACPDDCNDRGRCVNGKCVCDSGFTGADCSETTCPGNCNNRGRCIKGECICDDEFSGPDCSERTCPNDCSDQGRCVNGKCVCDSGFTGDDCSEKSCPGNCNNRGRCINGQCVCEDRFTGADCSERTCPNDCSDQGRCVNGKCVCDSGFTGDDCSEKSCPGNCNNRGRCVNGQCVCEDRFTGADCSEKACPNNCSNRGRCVNGKCVCDVGSAGPDCAAKGCPNNCNNKGRCVKGRCVCRRGFTGPDCSQCESGMTGPNCDIVMSGVSQLSTRDITETSVTLFWTAPPVQYDTYYITFTSQKESDQQINVQVEGSLTTFTQTGLAAGQDYTASIIGEIDGRKGAESSTEFMTLISGPTNLRAVKTTSTSAVVQWEQSQGEIHKYRLTVTPNDRAGKSQEMIIPAGQDSAHIQQLEAGRLYDIILVAEKGTSQSKPATTQVTPGNILPGVTTAALTMQITLAPGQDVEDRDQEVNPSPEVQVFDQQGRREDGSEADSINKVGSIDGPNRDSSTSVTAKTKPLVSRMVAVNGTRPKVPGRPTLYKKPNVSGPFRFNTTKVVPGRKKVGPGPLKKPPVGQKKKAPILPKKLKPGVHTIGDRTIALTVRDPSVDASPNERRDDKNPAKMSGTDSDTNRQSSSEEPTVGSKEQPDVGMAGQGNDTAPVSSEPTRTVQSQEKKCMNKVKVTHVRLPHRGRGSGCRGDGTVLVGQTPGSDQGSSGADDLKPLSAETDLDYTPDPLHKLLTDTFDSLNITTFSVHLSNPSNLSVNAETVRRQMFRELKPLAPSLSESSRLSSSHSSTLQSSSSHSSSPLSSSDESGSVGSNELDAENSKNKPEITSPEDQKLPPTGKGGAPLFHPTPAKHSYITSAGDRKPPPSSSLASAPSSYSSAPPLSSSTTAPSSSLLQSSAAPLSSLPSSSSSPSLAPPLSSSTEGPSLLTNFISPSLSSSPSSPSLSLSSSDKSGSVGSNEQDADNSRITTDVTSPEDRKLPPLGKGGAPLFRRTPAKHGHIRRPRPNFGSFQNKTRLNLRDPHLSTPHLKLTLRKQTETRHASTSELSSTLSSSASEDSSLVEAIAAVRDTSADKDWATTPTSSGIKQLQKNMPTERGRIPMRHLPPKGGYMRRINFGPFQNRTRPNLRLRPPSARPLNPASETKRDHISSTELPATSVSKEPYPAKGAGPIVAENEDRVGTRISSTNMSTEFNQTLRGSGVPSSHRPTTKIGHFRHPQLHGGRVQNKTRINLRSPQHPQRGPMRKPLPTKNLNGSSSIPVESRFSQLKKDTTPKIQEKQSGSQAIPMPTQRVQLEKDTTPEIQDNQSGGQAAPMPTQRVKLEKNSTPETPDNQSEEQAAPMPTQQVQLEMQSIPEIQDNQLGEQAAPMPTQRVQLEMESIPEIHDNQLGEQAAPMPTQGFQIEQSGDQHTAEVTPRAQIDGHVTTIRPQINKSEEGNNAPVQTTKSGEEENIIPDSTTDIHKERVIAGKNIGTTSQGRLTTNQTASDSRYRTPKRVTLPKRRPPMKGPHQTQIRHYNSGSQRRQDTKTHNTTKRLFGKRPEQRRSEDSKLKAGSSSGVTREPLDYVGVTNRTSDGFTLIWDSPEEKYKNFVVTSQNVEKDERPKPKESKNNLEEDQGGPKKQGGNREEEGKHQPTKETESEKGGSEGENRVPESVSTQVRKIQSSSKAKLVTGSGEIFKKVVPGSARSFQFENLPPQTEYTVTLLGKGPGLLSKLHKLVISTGPEPPTDIVFSEVTDNSLTVSWTKPKTPISGFKVTYTHTEEGEPVSVSVDSDDSTVGLSQLSPGSSYEVSVISILGLDESDPIKDFVMTLPDPPTDLRAVNITDTKALLLWRPALATVDKYAIVYGSGTDSELRITVSGNAAEQQLSGLEGSTTYTVTITSQLGSKESSVASTSFTTTGGSGRDGDGPRDLQANNVTPRTALLSWKPPLNPAGGYRLTYQTDGQELKEVIVDASLTEYNLTKLHPGSKYTVQLQAEGGGRYTSAISTDFTTGTLRFPFPADCSQELLNGIRTSGEVEIFPQGKLGTPMMVFCDMETDGGGWMVFQRRKDGSENFFRGWKDYTKGFGSLSGEFWLGLEALHNLTAMTRMILRVDLQDKNDAVYAKYSTFEVAKRNYKLTVGGYSGTAGDSLSYHNQRIFSTKDRDLAPFITRCAMSYRGGWWYKNCHEANLNGLYGISVKHQGVIWTTWRGKDFSIPFTEMKMRPAAFRG
ncbi:mucin-17 isoform X1 [Epinephelus fuscoguttatus]|uniref:mucin-17 isoform X1 n=1 Tax=Epinephelus fuscoguttatus TaxID=293821 RepID=UPI0020D0CCF6|nr:mucin-17 isoform X1 [Epinephelus fuscoguttatus]